MATIEQKCAIPPVIRLLYVGDNPEGKDIQQVLDNNNIQYRLFLCKGDEIGVYDCPRLVTTEGEWRGRSCIEKYPILVPVHDKIRKRLSTQDDY